MTRQARGRPFPSDPDAGAVAGLVTTLTLGTAFGLMALGVEWFWVAFPVGFGGVLPVAVGAAKRHRGRDGRRRGAEARSPEGTRDDTDAALARLRERYANDELDEAAFERRLERLLLTEDADAARAYAADRAEHNAGAGASGDGRGRRVSDD